jgi:hypothetical protein
MRQGVACMTSRLRRKRSYQFTQHYTTLSSGVPFHHSNTVPQFIYYRRRLDQTLTVLGLIFGTDLSREEGALQYARKSEQTKDGSGPGRDESRDTSCSLANKVSDHTCLFGAL